MHIRQKEILHFVQDDLHSLQVMIKFRTTSDKMIVIYQGDNRNSEVGIEMSTLNAKILRILAKMMHIPFLNLLQTARDS